MSDPDRPPAEQPRRAPLLLAAAVLAAAVAALALMSPGYSGTIGPAVEPPPPAPAGPAHPACPPPPPGEEPPCRLTLTVVDSR